MSLLQIPLKAGHSGKSLKPAFLPQIHLLACSGIECFLPSELPAALQRILHLSGKFKLSGKGTPKN